MARPAYKALYLHQLQAAGEQRDRADRAERELRRIQAVLAPAGKVVLETLPPELEPGVDGVQLAPLDYECAKAFMQSLDARFHGPLDYGWFNMSWRGYSLFRGEDK